MNKILVINDETVQIGMENGELKEFKLKNFDFAPSIGDFVDIFKNENQIIISKHSQTINLLSKFPKSAFAGISLALGASAWLVNIPVFGIVTATLGIITANLAKDTSSAKLAKFSYAISIIGLIIAIVFTRNHL